MSESEILLLYVEMVTFNQTALAGWLTITFGLYSIAYMAGDRLKLGTVLFIIFSYIFLTFIAVGVLQTFNGFIGSLIEDILALQSSGSQISNMSLNLIQAFSTDVTLLETLSLPVIGSLLEAGAIGYLIYRHREGQRAVGGDDA